MSGETNSIPVELKVVALCLALGGAFGVITGFVQEGRALLQAGVRPSLSGAFAGAFVVLSGTSVWTGLVLWKGKPWAVISAQILFIAQLFVLRLSGFSYQLCEGVCAVLQFSKMEESKFGVFFHAGSDFAFRYSSESEGTIVGVNVVAVAALIYLSRYVDQRNKRIQHAAEAAAGAGEC